MMQRTQSLSSFKNFYGIDGSNFMILQRLKIELRDRDLMVAELRSQLAAQRVSAFVEHFDTPAIGVTLKIIFYNSLYL